MFIAQNLVSSPTAYLSKQFFYVLNQIWMYVLLIANWLQALCLADHQSFIKQLVGINWAMKLTRNFEIQSLKSMINLKMMICV